MAISNSDEDGFALACDEHVFFLEYSFVKTETVPSSAVLPTLIKKKGSPGMCLPALLEQRVVGMVVGLRI
jgi:hypothetical protein